MTTLRRYIRSGRLSAEKTPGRYGPEYTISLVALEDAGVREMAETGSNGHTGSDASIPASPTTALSSRSSPSPQVPASRGQIPAERLLREMVPIDLFRELSMKHEQLLVQYGMVRVGGQKMLEYKGESERLAEALRNAEETLRTERDRYARETGFLKKHLRQAELEIEERNQELATLRDKARMLELLSRNAITTESIERQFLQVFDKRRELEELAATSSDERRRKMAALDEVLKSGFQTHPDEPTTDQ